MMSVRKLPFIVQPRLAFEKEILGTDESGKIEVERRGYLTVGEKALTQQATKDFTSVVDLYSLVGRIAEEEDKDPKVVLSDFSAVPSPPYLTNWSSELTECMQSVGIENTKRRMIYATAILISRVDSGWEVDDTMSLNSDLVEALAGFYEREDNGAVEELSEEPENTGAEGKK